MMKIQPINDERLKTQNLKNIRIIYALQTIGILAVMGYQYVIEGIFGMQESPVWILFLASTIILAFLSFNSDERLVSKNLQKIRIAYVIQVVGIVGTIAYDLISGGIDKVPENPLWIVFIISTVVLTFLTMNSSVAHETSTTKPGKGLSISLLVVFIVSITVGFLTVRNDGTTILDGVLTTGAFIIVGSIPFFFLYGVRKNNTVQ